jgi:hypothetical protein
MLYWQRVQTDRLTPRRQDAKRKNLATWRLSVRREEKRHLWPRAVYAEKSKADPLTSLRPEGTPDDSPAIYRWGSPPTTRQSRRDG